MTTTLFTLAYQVLREIGTLMEGTATGGSTTTIIDTNDRTEVDDYWNGGTAFIVYDAGGAGAAPEKEYSVISDSASSTKTITLRSTLTAAVASGDKYAVCTQRYPLERVVQEINDALMAMGRIPIVDTTSVQIDSNKTEYSLPIAANTDLRQVWIQNVTSDANDNRWQELNNWYIQRTATGTADLLVFPYQLPEDYYCKLVYLDQHPELRISTDKLSETVHPERVIYHAATGVMKWFRDKRKSNQRWLLEKISDLESKAIEAEIKYPIPVPPKTPRITMYGTVWELEDTPNHVYLSD
jgi:hypothetical protein